MAERRDLLARFSAVFLAGDSSFFVHKSKIYLVIDIYIIILYTKKNIKGGLHAKILSEVPRVLPQETSRMFLPKEKRQERKKSRRRSKQI